VEGGRGSGEIMSDMPPWPPEPDPFVALVKEADACRVYLFVVALRILRNASDAEEVVDATVIRLVLEKFRTYDPREKRLKAYLKTCVVHDCYKFLYHARRHVPIHIVVPAELEVSRGYVDTVQELKRADLLQALEACLERMDEEERMMILLHHSEGVKIVEIARLWGIKNDAAKQRLKRARERFIKLWIKAWGGDIR
jgi:RNA polymerase sigma-70 factor (ECF subfamily)